MLSVWQQQKDLYGCYLMKKILMKKILVQRQLCAEKYIIEQKGNFLWEYVPL